MAFIYEYFRVYGIKQAFWLSPLGHCPLCLCHMVLCEAGSGDLSPRLPFSPGYVPSVAEHVPTDILTVQDMLFKASQSSDPTKDTMWIR